MKWIVFSDKGVDMNKTELWREAQNISPETDSNPISVDEIDLLRGIRDGRYDPQNWEAELTRIIKVLEDK